MSHRKQAHVHRRALAPDELIKSGKVGRIRLIETRKPRRPTIKRRSR
ncbi:MAG: hypothetical protein JO162_12890 [Alphaproteobacteria bacterium]|nr:hypothetical protein [Alphaproteobacteria bacterium]